MFCIGVGSWTWVPVHPKKKKCWTQVPLVARHVSSAWKKKKKHKIHFHFGVNALLVPIFCTFSILVITFYFYHFQSLNQLTPDIQVFSVTQLTAKANVANGGTVNANVSIKIILKMLHQHPCQLPHQHLNLKNKLLNLKIYKKPKKIIKNKKNCGTQICRDRMNTMNTNPQ